jgi:pimeloyl-ACP methyl ester carboxylesterase
MFIHLLFGALLGATPAPGFPPTGLYSVHGHAVYVGTENYEGHTYAEYFDSGTRRFGELRLVGGDTYETTQPPARRYTLTTPSEAVEEDRFTASDAQGRIGFSVWHVPGARSRPTIVLIHGADDETRDMGFSIPFFVAHGMSVITFDQRGTGESTGNWQVTGPEQKAADIVAILRLLHDRAVDLKRVGVWGPSNGGWVAPIVANEYPLAFMILKSAPAESIESNVSYEVQAVLREHHRFSERQIASAMEFETTMFTALRTRSHWTQAQAALTQAKSEPWFQFMRIPPGLTMPPPPPMLAALRASLEFDPASTLQHVHVPTLALFGALDKNVDAADSARRLRADFRKSGLRDVTVRTFPGADHLLERSSTGYIDEAATPNRLVPGYPEAMIDWLSARGFAVR